MQKRPLINAPRPPLERLGPRDIPSKNSGSIPQVEYGSGNVFADLGFENPEEELARAMAIIAENHVDIRIVRVRAFQGS